MLDDIKVKQKLSDILEEFEAKHGEETFAQDYAEDEEFIAFLHEYFCEERNSSFEEFQEFVSEIKHYSLFSRNSNLIALGFIVNVALINLCLNIQLVNKNQIIAKSVVVKALEGSLSFVASLVSEMPDELYSLVKKEVLQAISWYASMADQILDLYKQAIDSEAQVIGDLKALLEK